MILWSFPEMALLHFGPVAFDAELVIFDKDGTLIDFVGLWARKTGDAVTALAAALSASPELATELYGNLGYDPVHGRFDHQSPVITAPMSTLYTIAAATLYRHGWGWLDAELEVERHFIPAMNAYLAPEEVTPLAKLPAIFGALQGAGVQIAVVTSDDRGPTVATLELLGVAQQVAFIACADDDYPHKPAPEALWAACAHCDVAANRTVMVGDSTTDMLMAQRAQMGLRAAVLTGVMTREILAPHADVVLPSIGAIQVAVGQAAADQGPA
jgi:phosphoglycolate phosphatase